MKYHLIYLFGLLLLFSNVTDARYINKINRSKKINNEKHIPQKSKTDLVYRFASSKEADDLLLSNKYYFDNMNQNDLNFRMQKLNATQEELEEFVKKQILDFTRKDKNLIANAMKSIKKICKKRGYKLPPINDIVFVKTTAHDENDAGGYTHGTQIYLSEQLFNIIYKFEGSKSIITNIFNTLIAHELFHCLTRNHPEFRKDMYSILGFTVVDKDYEFPKEIADRIIINPDVEHHNSYATFEINGEKKNCTIIFSTTKPFEEPGDNFFDNQITYLVPIDDLNTLYEIEQASNFWDVFGNNTNYVIDPEETLADNFSYTIIDGLDGKNGERYETPRIIESIDAYLKSYNI